MFWAEAQKVFADVNVDTHVRRALLRKTAYMRMDDISPEAKVAVWREQLRGRSTKKKGRDVIRRLITWDGSYAWIQVGWQTVKVDRAQMRPTYGFENSDRGYQSSEDRREELPFLDGEVSDEREPGPEDELLVPEILNYGDQAAAPDVVPAATELYRLPEAVAQYQRSEGVRSEGYGPFRRESLQGPGSVPYGSSHPRLHHCRQHLPPSHLPRQRTSSAARLRSGWATPSQRRSSQRRTACRPARERRCGRSIDGARIS